MVWSLFVTLLQTIKQHCHKIQTIQHHCHKTTHKRVSLTRNEAKNVKRNREQRIASRTETKKNADETSTTPVAAMTPIETRGILARNRVGTTPSCSSINNKVTRDQLIRNIQTSRDTAKDELHGNNKQPLNIEGLVDAVMNGIGDVPEDSDWVPHFETAAVRNRCPQAIHVWRVLDMTKEAFGKDLHFTNGKGFTAKMGECLRPGVWLNSWHIDNYIKYLNCVAKRHGKNQFHGFSPIDTTGVFDTKFYAENRYSSTTFGFNKLTMLEVIKKFKLVAFPVNTSGSHWHWTMVERVERKVAGRGDAVFTFKVRHYCSMSKFKTLKGIIMPILTKVFSDGNVKWTERHGESPIQKDASSCGPRTLLGIQSLMIKGTLDHPVAYQRRQVEPFRYMIIQRLLGHHNS